jgi:microsomal dipeptidase-like Zn-dependent dipeptidase
MIADLHCHFPMHLVEAELEHPRHRVRSWLGRLRDHVDAEAFELVARIADHPGFGATWGVDLDGLARGGVGIVCSVLDWPFCEFQPAALHGGPPDPDAFACLWRQLDDVEEHLAGTEAVIVRTADDLDAPGIRFVHCVEGGFHLGPDPADVDAQVRRLAERGVFYVTLAHLVYRGVVCDAPALPPLTDAQYDAIFAQPRAGISALGRAAIEAMCRHRVIVDLSHMRRDAVAEALTLLDELDPEHALPVIASHVGAASAGPPGHAYNLTPETMRAIRDRGGAIGLIMAQRLLGRTPDEAASRELLGRHIAAIHDAVGSHAHTAIGSDLDGFIAPKLAGVERAEDLATLEAWVRDLCEPDDAAAILHANAERVLRTTFVMRAAH